MMESGKMKNIVEIGEKGKSDDYKAILEELKTNLSSNNAADAVRSCSKLVTFCHDNNLNYEKAEEGVKLLMDYVRGASVYKQRVMAAEMSKLELYQKIVLLRQFRAPSVHTPFVTPFSVDAAYCISNGGEEAEKLKKPPLTGPMAFGRNSYGKLGVGNHVEELTKLTPILLPSNELSEVFFSENHTYYLMKNQDVYGAGRLHEDIDVVEPAILHSDYDLIHPNVELCLSRDDGKEATYEIHEDGSWSVKSTERKGKIVFLVCGKRFAMPRDSTTTFHSCINGDVFLLHNGTVYKGTLKCAPRPAQSTDEVIVALMEEMVLPFTIDNFSVSRSGDSFVVFPSTTPEPVPPLLPTPPQFISGSWSDQWSPVELDHLEFLFSEIRSLGKMKWTGQMYSTFRTIRKDVSTFTGLPGRGINVFHRLLAIQHYFRIDEVSGDPANLLNGPHDAATFEAAVKESVRVAGVFKPVVVGPGWGEEEREKRKKAVLRGGRDAMKAVIDDIDKSLQRLNEVAPRFSDQSQVQMLGYYAAKLFRAFSLELNLPKLACEVVTSIVPHDGPDMKKLIQARVKAGDIQGADSRFETIRIEAISASYKLKEDRLITDAAYSPRFTHITALQLNVIAPELVRLVNADKVLNLNVITDSEEELARLCDVFFPKIEKAHLEKFKRSYNIAEICQGLPDAEKFVISCADDKQVEMPSVLFEIFSDGFDAARQRAAEAAGEDKRRFNLDATSTVVRHLVETLIDIRCFYRLDMEAKEQLFSIACHCVLKSLETQLMRMIIMSAREEDHPFIATLFKFNTEFMISQVAELRPDMIFDWERLPMDRNQLEILQKMSPKLKSLHFSSSPPPLTRAPDAKVDDEQIAEKWLYAALMNEEQDKDVKEAFEKTIAVWAGRMLE